jgi:small-conductance mechanosensitive channel
MNDGTAAPKPPFSLGGIAEPGPRAIRFQQMTDMQSLYSWILALHVLPPWLIGAGVFAAILLGAIFAQSLIMRFLRQRAQTWRPTLKRVFLGTKSVVRFTFFIVAVTVALPLVPFPAALDDDIRRIMAAGVIVLIGWIASIASNIAIDRYMSRFKLDVEDNLLARKAITQARVFKRLVTALIAVLTAGFALMTFESVRQYGISLFASAGAAGIIAGLAARPVLGNLLAGIQLAMTQPIRLDDAVVVEGEWGWVEEFTSTYVVIRLWDWRRLIVPLTYFLENSFQNWTRSNSAIVGSVMLHADYSVPVERLRKKLDEIVKSSKLWDGQVANLQVTDADDKSLELRALVSSRTSSANWDLRCEVREKLIAFLRDEFPQSLPRARSETITSALEKPARRAIAVG